jgi:uncharacterized damage-inducible protein DinB
MAEIHPTLSIALGRSFLNNLTRIGELASPVSEEHFWQKPFSYGNSFGHLVLHLTGNLNYYIGAQIAQTGFARDRPREFNDPNPPSKKEALEGLQDAVAMAITTIGKQSYEDWTKEYWAEGTNCTTNLEMVLQCAAHMQHHIGQMIYLNHEWQKKA